jgi:hydroxyacylglutathione hydrolase
VTPSMDLLQFTVGQYQTNSYVLFCGTTHSLIVDPGDDVGTLLSAIAGTELAAILLTHGHPDHTGALVELHRATDAPIGVHPRDANLLPIPPQIVLQDGTSVRFGVCRVPVHHLPGHTAGSVAFELAQNPWLVGDTLFPGGPGHTDSPAQFAQLIQTLWERVFVLPPHTRLLPGHGPPTTVGREFEPFHAFLRHGWSEDAYGDIRWDTRPDAL